MRVKLTVSTCLLARFTFRQRAVASLFVFVPVARVDILVRKVHGALQESAKAMNQRAR